MQLQQTAKQRSNNSNNESRHWQNAV